MNCVKKKEALAKIINGTSSTNAEEGFFMPGFEAEENTVGLVDKELVFEEKEEIEKDTAYLKNLVTLRFRDTYLVAYSDFLIVFFDLLLVFIFIL